MSGLQQQLDQLEFRRHGGDKHVASRVYAHPMAEEVHQEQIYAELLTHPRPQTPNRLHIGVAGMFNMEIAALTRPSAMLLLDYNEHQEKLWHLIIDALVANPTLDGFARSLSSSLRKEYEKRDGIRLVDLEEFIGYFAHSGFWLNDDSYAYFRQMAQDGKIMTATIDLIGGDKASQELGEFVKRQGFTVDTCYWSNIGQYIEPDLHGSNRGQDEVFANGELDYRGQYYDRSQCEGLKRWDGNDERRSLSWRGRQEQKLTPKQLPGYERFLRNISAIAGETGLHMLTSNAPDMKIPPHMLETMLARLGPKRTGKVTGVDMRPIFFEGAPRRTSAQWQKREEARRAHDAALEEGRDCY